MPRKRMVDPGIWRSEQVNELSRDARLLFIGLFSNADDAGRLHGSAKFLRANIFPYDEDATATKVAEWRGEILSAGLAVLYENDGREYLFLPTWSRHQKIDRPSPSSLPPPNDTSTNARRTLDEDSSLIEDNRIEENGIEGDTGETTQTPDDFNPLEEEIADLQSWGNLTEIDRQWMAQFTGDYPTTTVIDVRDCRDYWIAKAKPHNAKVWKSRLRQWMKHKDTFGGNGATNRQGARGLPTTYTPAPINTRPLLRQ